MLRSENCGAFYYSFNTICFIIAKSKEFTVPSPFISSNESIPVLAAMLLQSEFEIPIESEGYPVVQISIGLPSLNGVYLAQNYWGEIVMLY